MVDEISDIAKSQIDFFSGAEGAAYTERNKDNLANCGANIIYNCIKLAKPKSVIEVGCGVGNNLSRISDICQITGVDINKKALEEAQKKYPNGKFIEGSIYALPFQNNSFDLVFCRGVLIHIPPQDRISAISELKRISKKHIITLEYNVKNEEELSEMVEWRGEKNRLWRINMEKYWDYHSDIFIKDYMLIPEDKDASNNHLCVARKLLPKKNKVL